MEMVPVDEQDYESEAQEWADLVADNRIAELAEMDRASLKDIIETLDTGEIDMELTGFTESELEDLMVEMTEEAISVKLDYEQSGSNLDSGSIVAIHHNSPLLDDEKDLLVKTHNDLRQKVASGSESRGPLGA